MFIRFKEYLLEGQLSASSKSGLTRGLIRPAYESILQKFLQKLAGPNTWQTVTGERTLEVDPSWYQELIALYDERNVEGFERYLNRGILLKDGSKVRLSELTKTKEFGSTSQRGAEAENIIYNFFNSRIQEGGGSFGFDINGKTYNIIGVKLPSGSSRIKADIILELEDNNLLTLSIKENINAKEDNFPGLAGMFSKVFPEITSHPETINFIQKCKSVLCKLNLCESDACSTDSHTIIKMLQCNKDKTLPDFHKIVNDIELKKIIVFGNPDLKRRGEYADYVVVCTAGSNPFIEKNGTYTFDMSNCKIYGDINDFGDIYYTLRGDQGRNNPQVKITGGRFLFTPNERGIDVDEALTNIEQLKKIWEVRKKREETKLQKLNAELAKAKTFVSRSL